MAFEFLNGDGPDDDISGEPTSMPQEAQQPEAPPVNANKEKYTKARASIEGAYGDARKTLTRNAFGVLPSGEGSPFGFGGEASKFASDVDDTLDRVNNREHPLKLSDDLRDLASRKITPPKYAEMLHGAADKMLEAYRAQGVIDEMKQPGGALAVSPQEQQQAQQNTTQQAQQLDQQIQQKQGQLKNSGNLRAPQIQQDLQALQNQRQNMGTLAQPAEQNEPSELDEQVSLDHIAAAGGVPRREIVTANTEMRRMVQAHGVNITDPVSPMTFPIVVTNLVSTMFNPTKAAQLLSEMLPENPEGREEQPEETPPPRGGRGGEPSQKQPPESGDVVPDQLEKDPRFANLSSRIARQEARRDKVWQELRNSKQFNNVGDVLGFIVCSVLIGAQNAAHIFTNMDKVGSLRWELDRLDHETSQLYHQQNSYIALSQHARENAASQNLRSQQLSETESHHQAMEDAQYARMNALGAKIKDPDMRLIASHRLHGLRVAESNLRSDREELMLDKADLDRAEKIAGNFMDPQNKAMTDVNPKSRTSQIQGMRKAYYDKAQEYRTKINDMKTYRAELQKWFEKNAEKVETPPAKTFGPQYFENFPKDQEE